MQQEMIQYPINGQTQIPLLDAFEHMPPLIHYADIQHSRLSVSEIARRLNKQNIHCWAKRGVPTDDLTQQQLRQILNRIVLVIAKSKGGYQNTALSLWHTDFLGLVAVFNAPAIGEKDGSYFLRCAGSKRNNADTFDKAFVLILDADSRLEENGEVVAGAPAPILAHDVLKKLDIQHLIYTSFSNGCNLHKYRIVIPCEYAPEQLPILLDYVFFVLHKAGVMLAPVPENRAWSQAWYLPRVPDEQHKTMFEFYQHDGELLDVGGICQQWQVSQPEPVALNPIISSRAIKKVTGQRDPIAEFNQTYSPSDILKRNRYVEKNGRFLRPDSSSKIPAVQYCLDCTDGVERVYSHGGDVINDGHAHDAFDCYRLLECGSDFKTAFAWNPELTKHNQQLYMQEQAKNAPQPPLQVEQQTEPVAQQTIIDGTIAKLDADIAAWFIPEFIEALHGVYIKDRQEYKRIFHKLKKWKIAFDVDKEIKLFSKKKNKFNIPTLPALPTLSGLPEDLTLHQSSTKPAQKPIIKAMKSGGLLVYDDEGNSALVIESQGAVIMAECLQGGVAYSIQTKTWFLFVGTHWKISHDGQVDIILIELLYSGAAENGFKNAYKNNIKALIADGGFLPLPEVQHGFLPFQNGLLNYKSKQLLPITTYNAQTWCLPYDYDSQANCPTIKKWLLQAVNGDSDTVMFLRAWLAALLHGRADLQIFLHLIGSGGTGKGTFMRLATALVGEHNAVSTTLKEMETNRFEPARFYVARLVKITDSDKYGGSVNTLKALTGQDHIRIERKHQQQSIDYIFNGLVVMGSNENLVTTDHTSGLDRRLRTVHFDRRATDEEKQAWQALGGEEAVLHSEIAGLVVWLLELSQDDISRIINNPPTHTKIANFEAMTAGNPIAEWITECCIPDTTAWTQIGDKREVREQGQETIFEHSKEWLYPNYLTWCQRHNKSAHSVRSFREITVDSLKTLKVDVIESRRSQGQGISNIRLKRDDEPAFTGWQS